MIDPDWDEDWEGDEPDPDDPCYYLSDDDGREALTPAERNPSLCRW